MHMAMPNVFEIQLRAVSGAFYGRENLDKGAKIVLPNSAMMTLAHYDIASTVLLFRITSKRGRKTHAGVLEFTAEEGQVILPIWMCDLLNTAAGEIVTIRSVAMPKGSFIKIRPQKKAFIELSNPKAVLEHALDHNYACLTVGDSIPIHYNDKVYLIDIREVKAVGKVATEAICIVDTDIELEFERPLDMPDDPPPPPRAAVVAPSARGGGGTVSPPPGGASLVFGGNTRGGAPTLPGPPSLTKPSPTLLAPAEEKKPMAFSGQGRSLSGKMPASSAPVVASQAPSSQQSSQGTKDSGQGRSLSGKMPAPSAPVVASHAPSSQQSSQGAKDSETDKTFTPFGGKGRSLK